MGDLPSYVRGYVFTGGPLPGNHYINTKAYSLPISSPDAVNFIINENESKQCQGVR